MTETARRPLAGLRVIEVGQLLAGPFTGTLLAYFGAEVIKIEPPGGDPIRGWRKLDEGGTSYWWRSLARNKKCVTIDLKTEEGRALVHRLADTADVLIENFRPGVMENWGLGPRELAATNQKLVYARISGYGQTGPYAAKPGYASVTEGISGFRYVNGFPGEAPVRPNLSMGDSLGGLHAALGILIALWDREQHTDGKQGQVIDVALYESIFNLMEGVVPEYSGAGLVREPSGTTVTGIVPTNTYRCRDGRFVVIGGNGDSIFQRLMKAAGQPEMAADARLSSNAGRVAHEKEIDEALARWCSAHDSAGILSALDAAQVPGGPIYSVADMVTDPHFRSRGLFENVLVDGKPLAIPAILPKLTATPGGTEWPGPAIGSHEEHVLRGILGLDETEIAALRGRGVI